MKNKIGLLIKIIIMVIIAGLSTYLGVVIGELDVLPNKYLMLFIGVLVLLNIIGGLCLIIRKWYTKIISGFMYLILIIISVLGISYGSDTIKFLNKAFNNNTIEVTDYNILVLKTSLYKEINDIKDKNLGYLTSDPNTDKVLKSVKEKVNTNNIEYEDLFELYKDLKEETIPAIVLDASYLEVLSDEEETIYDDIKSLYSFKIEEKIEQVEEVETLKPMNIYISGSDSRSNKIASKSRSDVNLILSINPDTKKVLITAIPRDYYVDVYGKTGLKDKLTHAGIYGIETSVKTLENLFNIEIDYSIKVGMSAVVEVVDLVGGVDIYSDTAFNSYHMPGWRVEKGINHMDGAKALAYARERYAYISGDRHRIKNQQQVLEAVLNKIVSSKTLLLKYEELLNSLSELYRTDIPKEVVTMLVKMQLENMSSWSFESQSVDGKGAYLATYTAPNSKRYVMVPYENDVKNATIKINEVLNIVNETEE